MIMIVTFHEEFRGKISAFLSEKGYEVCIPPHRQDVVPLVKEKSPLVVVLDMYVAEPSGLEVLRELRAQNYSGKVVALAGTSVSSLMSQAFQLGVDQVIGGFQGSGGAMNLDQVESAIKMALHPGIAKRAFELYEARGQTKGNDLGDWLEAERQIFNKHISLPVEERKVRAEPESASRKPRKTQKKSTEKT
ncbi:response regulator [uncultured Nitrospira sp.]|uniref:response regulator n=1 Tax=uncultured Nitrospira sp. TaxID=157176 RepID=UPI0031408B0C